MSSDAAENIESIQDDTSPSVPEIMSQIKDRVRKKLSSGESKNKKYVPLDVSQSDYQARAGELLHSEELAYLNTNFASGTALGLDRITSHRPGLVGKLIVKVKRKILYIIWDNLLREFYEEERNYRSKLVRFLNNVSKYVDNRDASNFWELIRKIDYDVTKTVERVDRLHDDQIATLRTAEQNLHRALNQAGTDTVSRFEKVETVAAEAMERLKVLDSVVGGLESLVARSGRPQRQAESQSVVEGLGTDNSENDKSYVLLENRFRGSREDVADRLKHYLEYFEPTSENSVLEVGCGRGELQELLRSKGVKSYGIDIDAEMVSICKSLGLDATLVDANQHLASLKDKSLQGVIAVQVAEHLTREYLEQFLDLAFQKICPGGYLILETINPTSMLALSSNYFRDPTHVWPLHPDTLGFMMSQAGFLKPDTKYLSPVPEEACLKPLKNESFMTPQWRSFLNGFNTNIDRLNSLLFGYQDYCLVARKGEK